MKRAVLTVVLVALVIVELYLFTGFLPTRWQVAINDTLCRILPQTYDHSVVTHPAIDQEIEQAMKELLPSFCFSDKKNLKILERELPVLQ